MDELQEYAKLASELPSYFIDHVDLDKRSLLISFAAITFNPVFWNIVARLEYHYQVVSTITGGNRRYGCYLLAVTIFGLGIFRDFLYERALRDQPTSSILISSPLTVPISGLLFVTGNVLVLTSMYALGVTGTYLGDYFGILMDSMVTGFPFNISSCPMYLGSTMSFLATALWFGKPAGILLTVWVWIMYFGALKWEDDFTAKIYRERDEKKKKGTKNL